ncbi:helix-turn-helix domain-containing protein [Lactiplantibacillus songbeiensis]|uniref:Helix-turn-helix domain-containing protein n=1 Tax=Lactiplantibacillus songbeiensis TaxID=2559920 RepID=A0ABW4C093_9LACO|nr:helix-turn-helix transcriptional regulator [Lactiplantibacillus songbeiensis]
MEDLGTTIRQIRLNKGFSQKEIYTGIMSHSFAVRFEQGGHDISATKLFAILDNLAISVDEFRFIQQQYQLSPLEQALAKTEADYQQQNFPALTEWVRTHRDSDHPFERLVASYNSIKLLAFDHRHVPITPAVRPAYDKLLATSNWTLQELRLMSLLVPLVATNQGIAAIPALTTKVIKNSRHYLTPFGDPFDIQAKLLDYYGTVFQCALNWQDYDQARQQKAHLMAIKVANLSWDGRLVQQFWLAIWELYFGEVTTGQANLDKIMAIENLFPIVPDTNLRTILTVRQSEAQQYRANH